MILQKRCQESRSWRKESEKQKHSRLETCSSTIKKYHNHSPYHIFKRESDDHGREREKERLEEMKMAMTEERTRFVA